MPYTNPWDDTVSGSLAANTIDDIISSKLLDIHERMDDIVEDWTADPVVPLSGGGGSGAFTAMAGYNDALGAGLKAVSYQTVVQNLTIRYNGNTNASSQIVINLNEINAIQAGDDWNAIDIHLPQGPYLPVSFVGYVVDAPFNIPIFVRNMTIDDPSNTVTLTLMTADDASPGIVPVVCAVTFGFIVQP